MSQSRQATVCGALWACKCACFTAAAGCLPTALRCHLPPQATANVLASTGVLPALLACLRWLVHEAQQDPAHHTAAVLLAVQHRLLSLLLGVAGRGPACAAMLAQAGAVPAALEVLEAPKVRADCKVVFGGDPCQLIESRLVQLQASTLM